MLHKDLPTIKEAREERRGIRYEGDKCPYCKQGILIQQTGKYGQFIGCNRFPYCAGVGKKKEDENKGVTSGGATIQKSDSILDMTLQQIKK